MKRPEQKKLTPFERETERRRKEMLRVLGSGVSHNNNIPHKRLKRLIAEGVKPVMAKDKKGNLVHLRKQHTGRNFFRDMAGRAPPQEKAA